MDSGASKRDKKLNDSPVTRNILSQRDTTDSWVATIGILGHMHPVLTLLPESVAQSDNNWHGDPFGIPVDSISSCVYQFRW